MHVRLFLRYSPKTAPSEISAKMATAPTKIRHNPLEFTRPFPRVWRGSRTFIGWFRVRKCFIFYILIIKKSTSSMNYCRNEFLRGLCLTLIRIKFVKTRDKFSSSHYPPPRRIVTLSIRWPGFGSPDTSLPQRARSLPGNPWALK